MAFLEKCGYWFDGVEVFLVGEFGLGGEDVGVHPMSDGRNNEVVVGVRVWRDGGVGELQPRRKLRRLRHGAERVAVKGGIDGGDS